MIIISYSITLQAQKTTQHRRKSMVTWRMINLSDNFRLVSFAFITKKNHVRYIGYLLKWKRIKGEN